MTNRYLRVINFLAAYKNVPLKNVVVLVDSK